jgi:hypothetical protein
VTDTRGLVDSHFGDRLGRMVQHDLLTPVGAIEHAWPLAPDPKPTQAEKRSFGRFAPLYSSFSEGFARFAVESLLRQGVKSVWDPFAGAGTLGIATRTLACRLLLEDINPFATLCSLVRASKSPSTDRARDLLGRVEGELTRAGADPHSNVELWTRCVLRCIGQDVRWLTAVLKRASLPLAIDEEAALILIFAAASLELAAGRRRGASNSTWIQGSSRDRELPRASMWIPPLIDHTQGLFSHLIARPESNRAFTVTTGTCDAVRGPPPPEKWDAIVTSPPYLTRLDYFKQLAPAVAPLLEMLMIDTEEFRKLQLGTTRIREKAEVRVALPPSVRVVLDRIRHHKSYASSRYYYWGYYYYFVDMALFLERAVPCLSSGGYLIAVLQSSFYKDVAIDLPALVSDMANAHGLREIASRQWPVRRHMGQISPRQHPKTFIEAAVVLQKKVFSKSGSLKKP